MMPNWIGIGICHLEAAKRGKFEFDESTFSLGEKTKHDHNCYMVSSNGWQFANKKQPEISNLSFGKGDVITCKFDPFKKLLIIVKNND